MDNLRHTIEVLFRYQEPGKIIKSLASVEDASKGLVCNVDKKWFQKVFCQYFSRYADDEVNGIYGILDSKWLSQKEKSAYDKKEKNIFNVLCHFTSEVLCEQGYAPVCKFDQLLRWQELTSHLGEDLFTTSFLAHQDASRGIRDRNDFAWQWHIPSDNFQIREIWAKGLADIHYHLNNSYAIFDLNWLSLMNFISRREHQFGKIKDTLSCRMFVDNDAHSTESLQTLCIRAAAIRLYLFSELYGRESEFDIAKWIKGEETIVCCFQNELQNEIEIARYECGLKYREFVIDYAIPRSAVNQEIISDKNAAASFFFGERRLLYMAFKKIFSHSEDFPDQWSAYLYEYLLIKSRFREEMIQINQHIGFDNFKQYQDRKDVFLKGTPYYNFISYLSVNSSTCAGNVNYIEARVKLDKSAENFVKIIRQNDNSISRKYFSDIDTEFNGVLQEEKKDIPPQNYIVQLHKKNQYGEKNKFEDGKPRNESLRKEIKRTVLAYNQLRCSSASEKHRVYGIDAVASETGCRPEYFGQAYRYLRHYSRPRTNVLAEENDFPEVGFTYHVGEDFLDIVDGLRAIDEAIFFLELRQGDRIGHGLALGVNAKNYYETRRNTIVLPKQDMLDNIVWLYVKCQELGITIPPQLDIHFGKKYSELLPDIYRKYSNAVPDYFVYYQSMLLRSDSPSLYCMKAKEVLGASSFLHFWDKCGMLVNDEVDSARKSPLACNLYYAYQFEGKVKELGAQSIEVEFPIEYQMVVTEIQKQMMKDIAAKGICIETNPSSNYNIAQLKRYDAHPITQFFNLGLTYDAAAISNCPQISVSINTDDQGLFSTSLENEYAILAAALIKQKNSDGSKKYTERMVYDWLERIREMGNEQKFENKHINHIQKDTK